MPKVECLHMSFVTGNDKSFAFPVNMCIAAAVLVMPANMFSARMHALRMCVRPTGSVQ